MLHHSRRCWARDAATCLMIWLHKYRHKNLKMSELRLQRCLSSRNHPISGPEIPFEATNTFNFWVTLDEFNGGAVFWSKQFWFAPLPAPSLYKQTSGGSWVFNHYCSEPPKWKTLLPEQHICGFVIFKVSRKLSRQRLSHGAWQSFVLIGLQCVHTFAFTTPLFCCRSHPNYLIYSKRVIMWLWTI